MNPQRAAYAPLARRAEQLPVETTGFVGRKSELAMLGALLASSRLVTVTGPGGVGKTRRSAPSTVLSTWVPP